MKINVKIAKKDRRIKVEAPNLEENMTENNMERPVT